MSAKNAVNSGTQTPLAVVPSAIPPQLSDYEKAQPERAKHRALIMQILDKYPSGLTTQQILEKELDYYGYTFLTDNRLRELRAIGWIQSTIIERNGRKLIKWSAKNHV